jgi:hypothetical protein
MIAIISIRVMDDAMGAAAMQSERVDLVVQIDGDPEGNLLKTVAKVEDLAADAVEGIRDQARQLRAEGAPAAPPRTVPLPRRGR